MPECRIARDHFEEHACAPRDADLILRLVVALAEDLFRRIEAGDEARID